MKNPIKDEKGSLRVKRGGGWGYNYPAYMWVLYRDDDAPTSRNYGLGFRLVKNIPKDKK